MRKLLLLAVSLLLTVTTIFAERVSQADAALVAKNFMSAPAVQTGVKKAVPTEMVLKKAASAEENQYYVYENANGEGWVMVAANDIAHPILAYSTTGQFRTDNQPMNLKVWLGGYDRQIKRAAADGVEASESIKQEWEKLRQSPIVKTATPVVSPLIKTGWDQDAPFWNLCPTKSGSTCYTGCVATAMAQVMNYWQWPKKGTGSHTDKYYTSASANFGSTTYDWANMLNTYGSGATSAQKTAVATLMYHCGIACDMQYGIASEGGSGAYTIDYNGYWSSRGIMTAEKALTQFFGYNSETVTGYYRDGDSSTGMKSWTKAEWIAMLKAELDAKRPIMYAGVGYEDPTDQSTGYGHSFVCDGYDNANYFHFNFGWTNWCDGYYDIDALETTDPGSGGGNGSYSLEQDVIIGIMPPGVDRNVTWMANGDEFAKTVASAGVISLPTSSPTTCENGRVFVGWTATEGYENATTAPTYVKEGDIIEADATYYAVFATKSETGGTSIEKASSIAVGDKVILVNETNSKELSGISSTKYGLGQAYTGTPTGAFPLDVVQGKTTGTFALMNGSNYLSWTSSNSLATITSLTNNSSWNISFSSGGDAVIKNSADETRSIRWNNSNPRFACYTSGQQAVQLYKIGGGASYKDYSLNCGTVEPCVLTAISLNTDNVKKTFTVGETFNSTGLVVTAAYSNCSDKTVTPTSVTPPDLTAAGNKTVTVSYTENNVTKTATYQISVTEPVKYNVTWSVNGVPGTPVQYTEGEALILPTTPSDCSETQVFVGWTANSSISGEPEDLFTTASGNVNANATYYAVFATKSSTTGGSSTPTKATSIAAGDKVVFVCEGASKELTEFSSTSTVYGIGTAYETTPAGTMVFDVEDGNSTGTFAFKNGNNYVKWSSGNSLSTATTKSDNTSWTVSISNGNATIANAKDATRVIWWNASNPRFACYTDKSAGTDYYAIQLYKVTASSTTTYSNYTLSCEEIVPCELTGITLNTEGVQTTFTVGDAFTSTGLVVTAAYSNCENKVVTPTNISTPDMSTVGTKTVTVTYTENAVTKTKDYTITVAEKPVVVTYTVKWHSCDGVKDVVYNQGAALVFPTTPNPNAGKTFYGWITDEQYTGTTAPAIISAGTPVNADADYYAVYE